VRPFAVVLLTIAVASFSVLKIDVFSLRGGTKTIIRTTVVKPERVIVIERVHALKPHGAVARPKPKTTENVAALTTSTRVSSPASHLVVRRVSGAGASPAPSNGPTTTAITASTNANVSATSSGSGIGKAQAEGAP
jgi:hypothetical protein